MRVFQSDEARAESAERRRGKKLRSLADKISEYAEGVHQRYPTGDVVVTVRDLAERLGKRPDAVANALNLLLREQKVQQAPLRGYWKLHL
jgi:DNA-binding transcriptional regulator YhcF (GntR family)